MIEVGKNFRELFQILPAASFYVSELSVAVV